jgi:tRNA threonylcarbamoyladenosine modification (KEOPS) complex Cgi121 subunit
MNNIQHFDLFELTNTHCKLSVLLLNKVSNITNVLDILKSKDNNNNIFNNVCLIKSNMIYDILHLLISSSLALTSKLNNSLTCSNVNLEIIYYLHPEKSINDALRSFGIKTNDDNVLVVFLDCGDDYIKKVIDNIKYESIIPLSDM